MIRIEDLWSPAGRRGAASFLWPVLLPAEGLFRVLVGVRGAAYQRGWVGCRRAPVPVLSVGGIEAGGVGKTPLVAELLRLAADAGLTPAVVTRGYGGELDRGGRDGSTPMAHAIEVLPDSPDAAAVFGDEPVWLAEKAKAWKTAGVWVARKRIDGAMAAARGGAKLILLDDALQHRRLCRDGEVVSLSGAHPFANGHLLPAGPLREGPADGLGRAHRVVLSQIEPEEVAAASRRVEPLLRTDARILSWRGEAGLRAVSGALPSPGDRVFLFAAVAHPERLEHSLRRLGHPLESRFFPDHHRFSATDLERLRVSAGEAGSGGRSLVTTEKDWVRLRGLLEGPGPAPTAAGMRLCLLTQTLRWNEVNAEEDLVCWMRGLQVPPSKQ